MTIDFIIILLRFLIRIIVSLHSVVIFPSKFEHIASMTNDIFLCNDLYDYMYNV